MLEWIWATFFFIVAVATRIPRALCKDDPDILGPMLSVVTFALAFWMISAWTTGPIFDVIDKALPEPGTTIHDVTVIAACSVGFVVAYALFVVLVYRIVSYVHPQARRDPA